MKYLIFILTAFFSISSTFAQDEVEIKMDGTKYYMIIYDGDKNEKVLNYYPDNPSWSEKIGYSDFFDGSGGQLWTFEENIANPGYINVRNLDESLESTHYLKSWNWKAYLENQTGSREGDQETDLELIYRLRHIFDGWVALETIEKPAGLYGIDYTPGPDALNVNDKGIASFANVKTSDITAENAVNKVFKLVEFDPIALFNESIVRGDKMYETNQNVSSVARFEVFYWLEKARETRIFGTNAEILAFQEVIDSVLRNFNQVLDVQTAIDSAKSFINASVADTDVKNSFNSVISGVEDEINADTIDYKKMDELKTIIASAQNIVNTIIDAETYATSLEGQDTSLITAMNASIDAAKGVLDNTESSPADMDNSISHLSSMESLLDEVIVAQELISSTQEFEEAKATLNEAITAALDTANVSGVSVDGLIMALDELEDAIAAFKKALEAGDTLVELINADFEDGLNDWNITSETPGAAYIENKGVDGSQSVTMWRGSAYAIRTFQLLDGLPNGKYQVSVMANVNEDSTIALYAESSGSTVVEPLIMLGGLNKHVLEIEVTDGMLEFGVKGNGNNDSIPAGRWCVMDNFEIKWIANIAITNYNFDDDLNGWTNNSSDGVPYIESKGVDGSKSVTYWKGSEYFASFSQTLTDISNGVYTVSAYVTTQALDSLFTLYATSGDDTTEYLILASTSLSKIKINVPVTNNTLEFGIKGSGAGNTVPAGRWIVFDNFEVVRLPDVPVVNPGFEDSFNGWVNNASDGVPYLENKGVEGSKSVTYWKGSDYFASTTQTVSGLPNGAYEISSMTNAQVDSVFVLFGKSGGNNYDILLLKGGLVKNSVIATVEDGSLEFGIRGAGVDNAIPAGRWIVFDNFEIKMKSIIPQYKTPVDPKALNTSVDTKKQPEKNNIVYWQNDRTLNIRSTKTILQYTIYSITGSVVESKRLRNNVVSVPLQNGIYIIQVRTEDQMIDINKVLIK